MLEEEDVKWWEAWRKRLRTPAGRVRVGKRGKGMGMGNGMDRSSRKVRGGAYEGLGKRKQREKEALEDASAHVERTRNEDVANANEAELDEGTMHEEMRILIKV
jgi:hypothetical protein